MMTQLYQYHTVSEMSSIACVQSMITYQRKFKRNSKSRSYNMSACFGKEDELN